MENPPGIANDYGVYGWLVKRWLAFSGRKIRVLQARDLDADGPALYVVGHAASFVDALALATALDPAVHCLLPKSLARGPFAETLASHMGIILDEGEAQSSESTLGEATDLLANGGSLVIFADQNAHGSMAHEGLASTAESLLAGAESQHLNLRIPVYAVQLFQQNSGASAGEILIYVDSAIFRPHGALADGVESPSLAAALESRFQENAFQLRTADLDYFLADLEDVLRAGLQQDFASQQDWKQDTEGFVLSRLALEWAKQTNHWDPGRLVALRKTLEEYRQLQRECARRETELELAESLMHSAWRRGLVWLELLLGLPIVLYAVLNHLAIGLVLFLAGSFKKGVSRASSTDWTVRGAVTLGFYALQTFLVSRRWGRAAAGYYAPTLPISGAYLWRYRRLVRGHARLLFNALTTPRLAKKIKYLREALMKDLDETVTAYEEKAGVSR